MNIKTINCKVVILGDSAVGKSCLAVRFIKNEFFEFQEPTIGAAFLGKNMILNNNRYKFEIWDTAGQERYRSLTPMYYRGARAAVVVYDITDVASFTGAKKWISEIKKKNKDCLILLVGNKLDLKDERKVSLNMVSRFIEDNRLLYLESSAKTGFNVQKLFKTIALNLPVEFNDMPTNQVLNIDDSDRGKERYMQYTCS